MDEFLPWLWAVLTSTWLLGDKMLNQSLAQVIVPNHSSLHKQQQQQFQRNMAKRSNFKHFDSHLRFAVAWFNGRVLFASPAIGSSKAICPDEKTIVDFSILRKLRIWTWIPANNRLQWYFRVRKLLVSDQMPCFWRFGNFESCLLSNLNLEQSLSSLTAICVEIQAFGQFCWRTILLRIISRGFSVFRN